MDFEFPPDALMLRDMIRRFLQKEARPLEMKYFTAGKLEPEERARLRKAIEQLGLWGLMAPEQFGGGGLDMVTACVVEEELGQTFVPIEIGNISPLLYACTGEQVSRFLEPALEGSRSAVIAAREPGLQGVQPEDWTTKALFSGSEYILNGQKALAAQPDSGDFFIVLAKTTGDQASGGLTAFLLDANAPGLSVRHNGSLVLAMEDCHVPGENVLGEVGAALSIATQEALRAWIHLGARYVGLAERLLEMAAEHARNWVSLGAPLAVRPAVQRMLAEMRVEIESARWLVYHAAWLDDSGKNDQLRMSAAQVRLATGEMLQHAVDHTTMIFAGPGPSPLIDPYRLVRSVVPPEAMAHALEGARAIISAQVLHLSEA